MSVRRFQLISIGNTAFRLDDTVAERPTPGPGQVLMRVRAASLNRRDVMILKGQGYPVGEANHFTPLSDAAGEIAAIGPDVTGFAAGDKIISAFFQNWPSGRISLPAIFSALGAGGPGVLAEYVLLSAAGITPMPAGWSFEQAACLPCAGVTAWQALVSAGGLCKGDTVLIQGTGGVALFGLQIAVAMGAKPVVISSSDAKLEHAQKLGAIAGINYAKQPDWAEAVRQAAGGGIDHVLELGGAGTIAKSLSCVGVGGHIALIGGLDGFGGDISAVSLIMKTARASAISVGPRAAQEALAAFYVSHNIQPVIDRVFSLDEAAAAYDHADAGGFGKTVINFG